MDKSKAIYEYLQTYPQLHSWLYFNTVISAPDNASMLTGNDVKIREYVDGSSLNNYIFSVAFMRQYDEGTSDINADAMEETGHFIEWLEEQELTGNFPVLDDNEEIQSIQVNDTMPTLAVDQETGTARYTLGVVISYLRNGR